MHIASVFFPDMGKKKVSGIDLQNRLSTLMFSQCGLYIELAEVRLRFPFGLQPNEWADVFLKHLKDSQVKQVTLKTFSVKMVGRESGKVILFGTFVIVVP